MLIDVNVMQLRKMGSEGWPRQLLDVLNGDIVTAEKETEKEASQVRFECGGGVTWFEPSGRLGGNDGRTNSERTRGRRACHTFPVWCRNSDQEE
jgi:hypothetical protein